MLLALNKKNRFSTALIINSAHAVLSLRFSTIGEVLSSINLASFCDLPYQKALRRLASMQMIEVARVWRDLSCPFIQVMTP